MLKIWTSYFYQIRNFPTNVIPLSTAVWDPKWFHNNSSNDTVYRDKRGVINGLKVNPLIPGFNLNGLCHGKEVCPYLPWECDFLKGYRKQLMSIDFDKFIQSLNECVNKIKSIGLTQEELEVALIFHEAADNPCSERMEVTNWFMGNGYPIEEWGKGSLEEDIKELNKRREESSSRLVDSSTSTEFPFV